LWSSKRNGKARFYIAESRHKPM